MKRRNTLRWAGLAPAMAGLVAAPALGQTRLRWNMALGYARGLELPLAATEDFMRRVRELTGGKFQITQETLAPSGAAALSAVLAGRVELAHVAPDAFADKDETYALGGEVPFGLNSRGMTAWYHQGNGLKLMREFHAERGVVNFAMGNTGAQMAGWYRRPVASPADLSGLKLRVNGLLAQQLMRRLGAVPMPGEDVAAAVERGQIDAFEGLSPHDDARLGLNRLLPNWCYPSWSRGGSQLELWVNRPAFEALPAEYKAAIEAAAWAAHVGLQARYDALNPVALKQLVGGGAKLFVMPKAVMDAAFKESSALCDEIAQRNPAWRRIYADLALFRRDQNLWSRFADARFDDFMQAQRL